MPLFARLAAIDPDALSDGPMAFDRSIFGANAHAALGLCAFRLGIYDQSAAHYARAETLAPATWEFAPGAHSPKAAPTMRAVHARRC